MLDGARLVPVLIAHAALQTIEWSAPQTGDYLAHFRKHRNKLERIASRKHARGQIEENGSIIVQGSDLQVF